MAELRVALVHDWLTGMRGGEKVLLELCRMFPAARIYTLLWQPGSVDAEIEDRIQQTSFLQRLPRSRTAYRYLLPLFPAAVGSLAIRDVDLVISSSHAVAKGVRILPGVPHVSYIHTPMRYLWDDADNYFRFGRARLWKRAALQIVSPALRRFDLHTADGVDHFIANSDTVRRRIQRVYRREASVIPPPVDTDFFLPARHRSESGYYLVVSSLEPYKRIDLALEAFEQLDRPLQIAGSGTQAKALKRVAGKNVTFLGRVSDAHLLDLYQNCRAVIVPGIEDFGIVPVEALACAKPVICCGSGGVTETVADGETGAYFWPQRPEVLVEAIKRFEATRWDQDKLRSAALRFSRHRFRESMREFLAERLGLDFDLRIARGAFHTVPAG